MKINEEILDVFQDFSIRKDDGICYLLCVYHGIKPTYIPKEFKIKMNTTKIVVDKEGTLHWNIPLFEGQNTNFQWVVDEYIPLFKAKNPKKGTYRRECLARMKKFFADYPEVRKEDVIGAVRLYLEDTDPRFIRKPHFFICKGKGADKIEELVEWVEIYRDSEEEITESRSTTRKLQ